MTCQGSRKAGGVDLREKEPKKAAEKGGLGIFLGGGEERLEHSGGSNKPGNAHSREPEDSEGEKKERWLISNCNAWRER